VAVTLEDMRDNSQEYTQPTADSQTVVSSGTTARNMHKNIRFNSKMDEWSIMARLQDYEAEKKREREMNIQRNK
jgi:hypothetical protein